jgi:hypothetical protein
MARRTKDSLEAAFQQLKTMFSGATLRAVADIKEQGDVAIATVGDSSSDTHDVHPKKRDIWVRFTDVLTGMSELGRLYAPAGILWRLTPKGQGAHVIRGRKMRGPGGALVIPDGGDGSTDNVVPGWLSASLSGISLPEGFEIESTGDQVKIVANSGGSSASIVLNKDGSIQVNAASGKDIVFNGGSKKAARVADPLAVGSLAGQAGPFPTAFVYIPMQDAAGVDAPGVPFAGPTVNLGGIVSNSGGAPNVKE